MLDDFAVRFLQLSEEEIQLVGISIFLCGAILAGIQIKRQLALRRAPYFVFTAIIFFILTGVQFFWILILSALEGGYFWVIVIVTQGSLFGGGYFFYRIARARSLDAYGHGRMAFLGFIPIANFWLLLTRSNPAGAVPRMATTPLLTGKLGVFSGLVVLVATTGLTVYFEDLLRRMTERTETLPPSYQTDVAEMVRALGVEETLSQIAAETATPVTVDEATTLARIEADGPMLIRTYQVRADIGGLPPGMAENIVSTICGTGVFIPLVDAGATIRETYVRTDGSLIGEVAVARGDCER